MIKSPLRYPGGKSRATSLILERFPEFQEYREPFLGGGSVFVAARQHQVAERWWVGDLNYDLWCFWAAALNESVHLIEGVIKSKEQELDGRALYERLKMPFGNWKDLAIRFFLLNRITFSGTTESGGYSQSAFENRFTWSSIERLKDLAAWLSSKTENEKISISYGDYSGMLSAPGKDVFIFLDPPYYSATKSALYGKNGNLHKAFDHERLATELKECPHKWLMTIDNCPEIIDLYGYWANIERWSLQYGMNNASGKAAAGKELFVSNF